MIETIEFDHFLKNFFEFANKYLNESHFHCLMEGVAGKTLKEIGDTCPRHKLDSGKYLMPYKATKKQKTVLHLGGLNPNARPGYYQYRTSPCLRNSEYEPYKYSNKKQLGISKERARQKIAFATRKWRKFLTVKYGCNWHKDYSA